MDDEERDQVQRLGVQFSNLTAEQEVRMREMVQAFFWETYDNDKV